MKLHLYIALSLFLVVGYACKSKQAAQEIVIPMGGQQVAKTPETTPVVEEVAPEVPAEVRSEQFKLEEGDSNKLLKYHVVVGSFKSKTNAQNLKNELIGENNPALIVVNEQGMFRVIIASFDELGQAQSKRNALKNRFHDVWLLLQKN